MNGRDIALRCPRTLVRLALTTGSARRPYQIQSGYPASIDQLASSQILRNAAVSNALF